MGLNWFHTISIIFFGFIYQGASIGSASKICYNDDRPGGSYMNTNYSLLNVFVNEDYELECRKCDDIIPIGKVTWFQFEDNEFNLKSTLNFSNIFKRANIKSKNYKLNPKTNSLMIKNTVKKNNGFISCTIHENVLLSNEASSVTYYLAVWNLKTKLFPFTEGSVTNWIEYRNKTIEPVETELLEQSTVNEFGSLDYIWGDWSLCHCYMSKFHSYKYRFGFCSIRINISNEISLLFPCNSKIIEHEFVPFYKKIKVLKNFKEIDFCYDPECIPDKKNSPSFKHKNRIFVEEGISLSIMCMTMENLTVDLEAEWVFDDNIIRKGKQHALGLLANNDTKFAVDSKGYFHLARAAVKDTGIYQCFVNQEPINMVTITVRPKLVIFSKEFVRALLTVLCFLLGCFFIYCFLIPTRIKAVAETNTI